MAWAWNALMCIACIAIMSYIMYKLYKIGKACIQLYKWYTGELVLVEPGPAKGNLRTGRRRRHVMTQSQCTYDRNVLRFKARENGFKESGYVSTEACEFDHID